MVKQIYDRGTDSTDTPSGSIIIQSSESNLDIVEFIGDYNLNLTNNDEFEYFDINNVKQFAGYIRQSENGDSQVYTGYDYGIETSEIPVRKNWEGYTALEIIEDIITNFTSLTWVTPVGIVDSSSIKLYPSRNRKANQIIDAMHKLLGTTHYVDFDKNFIVEYEGQELNSNLLQVGVNCNTSINGWESDSLNLVKNLTVLGDIKKIEEIQTLTGTGSQTEFELTSPYTDIKIEYPSGSGTFLTPYVEDISDGDYEILREVKKIVFKTLTPTLGTNFDVYYVYEINTNFDIVEVTEAEILAGTNPHHKLVNVSYLKEVVDCKDYATKYKNKFKNPLRDVILLVDILDANKYRANQKVRIIDKTHLVNGEFVDDIFIIKKLERSFGNGGYFVKLTCGDSKQFVFDRASEINERLEEFNETHPTAEIFNEGITALEDNIVEIEYEVTTVLKKATLPDDILVSDAGRTSTNEADHPVLNSWLQLDGNANDSSNNQNNGTWIGTEQYAAGKQFAQAAVFDGSSYIDLGDNPNVKLVNNLTICAWVKINTYNNFKRVLGWESDSSHNAWIFITFNDNKKIGAVFRKADGTNLGFYGGDMSDGEFHLLLASYDGDKMEFYIDDTFVGSDDSGTPQDLILPTNNPRIGQTYISSTDSTIGDFRIYNKVLTSSERGKIYNGGNGLITNTFQGEYRSINKTEFEDLFTEVT